MSAGGRERPAVRRVGRRRVVTPDVAGVAGRQDPTYDDRDTEEAGGGDPQRDRWMRDQRPPHWD